MPLSPDALPFFSCSPASKLSECHHFFNVKPAFVFLFSSVIFSGKNIFLSVQNQNSFFFYVLLFNVRGLEHRWQEVLLLIPSVKFDALILLETGIIDTLFYERIFSSFMIFLSEK